MSDPALAKEILSQILVAARRIERRCDDFLYSEDGQDRLDGICMMLIAIGESLKHLEKVAGKTLFARYPEIDWKAAKGMRDIISHQYFDLDAEVVVSARSVSLH
ncbi:MAG: HepT-like ribonuclease domain-containing protein [Gammaproteobacteria bacterium]